MKNKLALLFKEKVISQKIPENQQESLDNEISQQINEITKSMIYLHTSKELQSLPDLETILDLTNHLSSGIFDDNLKHLEQIKNRITSELFTSVCFTVLKTKVYNDKRIVETSDQIFQNLIRWASRQIQNLNRFQLKMINVIINSEADFYLGNGKESVETHPFGIKKDINLNLTKIVDELKENDMVDALKSNFSQRIWSPAEVKGRDGNMIKVLFENDRNETYIYNIYNEIRQYQTMQKHYQWRKELREGDFVDFHTYSKRWFLTKIIEITEEDGIKQLIVQDQKDKEEHTVNYFSTLIQKPNTLSLSENNESDIDDKIYLAQEKKFRYAILRSNFKGNSSVFFVKLINIFGDEGGFDFILQVMMNKIQVDQNELSYLMNIIKTTLPNLVKPFILENGEILLNSIKNYLLQNSQNNLRDMENVNIITSLDTIKELIKRLFNQQDATDQSNQIQLKLAIICVKSKILEKQFFGAKILNQIEKGLSLDDNYNIVLAEEYHKQNLFEIIIKGHPSLISKGDGILKILFQQNKITQQNLDLLWSSIMKSDLETRNNLLQLVQQISWQMSKEQNQFFIEKMLESADQINNNELFEFLNQLKIISNSKFKDSQLSDSIIKIIWKMIQAQNIVKKDFKKQIIDKFVLQIDDSNYKIYIPLIVDKIVENENFYENMKLLKNIIKTKEHFTFEIYQILKQKRFVPTLINLIAERIKQQQRNDNQLSEQSLRKIKKIMKMINLLKNDFLVFKDFIKLWNVMFDNDNHNKKMLNWIQSQIYEEKIEIQQCIDFYNKNILKLKQKGKNIYLNFFIIIFYKVNISQDKIKKQQVVIDSSSYNTKYKNYNILNTKVSELFGYDKLYDLYIQTEDEDLQYSLSKYITKLYFYPKDLELDIQTMDLYENEKNQFYNKCKQMILSDNQINLHKGIQQMQFLMQRQEKSGLTELISWNNLIELPKIVLNYEKLDNYYNQKQSIYIEQNKTLADVKQIIRKEYSCHFFQIEISTEGNIDLCHINNSLTIKSLNLQQNQKLKVKITEIPIKDLILLNETKDSFNDNTLDLLAEIFNNFCLNQKMNKKDMADFTSKATDGNSCYTEDDRIEKVFIKYSQNGEYLVLSEFVQFFLDAALQSDYKLKTVKSNLRSLGYDGNYITKNKQNKFEKNKKLIRYQIINDKILLDFLMKNFNDQKVKDFINYLSPFIDYLNNLIKDPIKFLKTIKNDKLEYCINLLQACIYQQQKIHNIVQYSGFSYNQIQYNNFLQKIYSKQFIEYLLRQINQISDLKQMNCPLQCLQGILQVVYSFQLEDYLLYTQNFIAYSMNQKKIKRENKKNQNVENDPKKLKPDPEKPKSKKKIQKKTLTLQKIKKHFTENNETIKTLQNQIPYNKLNETIIKILQQILQQSNDQNIKDILDHSIVILLSSLMLKTENIQKLLKSEKQQFTTLLFQGLTNKKTVIRLFFKNFYLFITSQIKQQKIKLDFLKIIFDSINQSEQQEDLHLLIDLASNLLLDFQEKNQKDLKKYFHFGQIFQQMVNKLSNHNSIDTILKDDNTLISILTFLQRLFQSDENIKKEMEQRDSQKLVTFLFKNCLFNIKDNTINLKDLICNSKNSRTLAMELLQTLTEKNVKLQIYLIAIGFDPLRNYLPNVFEFNKYGNNSRNTELEYIGINNPGCICYMIAMLQQFYAIPTFRYGILMADDYKEEEIVKINDNLSIDDNVFHQFQKMFAYLDISQRQDYDPKEFCSSYKDFSQQRVDVMRQQDAQEFLNMIFDKLENNLKPTPFQGILDSVFSGKQISIFKCQDCGFERSNEQLFYNLSLEVKNMENINDSFNKFIQKEIISDFSCDNCKKKCDVSKQAFLKDLPNVLIIHLQKIIFDLEVLVNVKLSHKYKFPKKLNLENFVHQKEEEMQPKEIKKKFSKEIEENIDFEYKLVGVVVHRGNANYGHYTSLININRNDPIRKNKDIWLEFDDSKISKFNMENFDDECFGSKMESQYPMVGMDQNVSKSAYILVYDKIKKTKLKLKFNEKNIQEKQKVVDTLIDKSNYKLQDNILETDFYNINQFIPDKYKQIIEKDNISQQLENQLFSSYFSNNFAQIFVNSGIPLLSIDQVVPELDIYQVTLCKQMLHILPDYFFKIYCVCFQNYKIKKIVDMLETSLMVCQDKVLDNFENNIYNNFVYIYHILYNQTDQSVTQSICHYITISTTLVIRKYEIDLKLFTNKNFEEMNQKEQITYKIKLIIDNLIKFIPNEIKNFKLNKKMNSFFNCLRLLCKRNKQIVNYLLPNFYLNKLYDIYMQTDTSQYKNIEKTLNNILKLIYLLLQQLREQVGTGNEQIINYFNHFANLEIIKKILKENYRKDRFFILKKFIVIICQNNLKISNKLIRFCLKGIQMANDLQCIGYLESLKKLMQIQDQFQHQRIQNILGVPRYNENKVRQDNQIVYTFGLGKENSLKRMTYKYLSPYSNDKALLNYLINFKDVNESQCLLILFYLVSAANGNDVIVNYLITLPPYNYMSCNLLDWVVSYSEYQILTLPDAYNPPKSELFYSFFNFLSEIYTDFSDKLKEVLKIQNLKYFTNEEEDKIESVRDNYMIGRTLYSRLISKQVVDQDEKGSLDINIVINKVCLMQYDSNGNNNLSIPKDFLSYDSFIDQKSITKDFIPFFGNQDHEIIYNDDTVMELHPLGEDSDNESENNEKQQKIKLQKYQEDPIHKNDKIIQKQHILRISIDNNTKSNHFLQIKITNPTSPPHLYTVLE